MATANAPVVMTDLPPPVPSQTEAVHEAAHAVAALALGRRVERVQIGVQARMTDRAGPVPTGWRGLAAISLAGPVAERWFHRTIWRPDDAYLKFFVDGIRSVEFGFCDDCATMLQIVANNKTASDAEVIQVYRVIELSVIEWVQDRDVWRTIETVSQELFRCGELNHDEILRLIGDAPIPRPGTET